MSLLLTYSIRSLWARRATTLATAMGVALVVFVLAASLMLAAGIRNTLLSAGADDHALVLQVDGYNEAGSQIRHASLGLVAAAPGVARSRAGDALVAGEVVSHVYLGKVDNVEDMASIQVRGVTAASFEVRPSVRLVAGRLAKPGTNEAMVGKALLNGGYAGVRLGEGFALKKNRDLTIVGVFEAARSAYESEVWADLDMVRDAFGMKGRLSSVTAVLSDADSFDGFKQTLEADKRLGLSVERERGYYEKVSNGLSASIGGLGMLISIIFALGAALGAMITMYGQVAQRRTEVGVLRAMGFSPNRVLIAFLSESVLLAVFGGMAGVLLAMLTPGIDFSVVNWASGQSLVFHFLPSVQTLGLALSVGVAVGIIGGVLPAVRASRTNPALVMRRH